MTATVTRAGPYYTSGEEIKFSSLRANFRAQQRKTTSGGSETFSTDTGEIKVSDLKRITTTLETNPIVPDATENANISTSSNWKTSQFRGSIKYYYITQSGTNLNFDIDNPPTTGSPASWNTNLNKNIQKFLFVDGTCGSNSVTIPAAQLNDAAYNLTVDVTGSILGAGGAGETSSSSAENGGDALEMTSTNGANNIVLVRSGAKIYGGGGGGEKGAIGAIGDTGSCWNYTYKSVGSGCNSCGDCGAGWERYGGCNDTGGCNCGGWWLWAGCRDQNKSNAECRQPLYTSVAGGVGGAGGNGGKGQGYDGNKTNGIEGVLGALGTCSDYTGTGTTPGQGKKGETGGNGGDWGSGGGNTNNLGNGGSAGRAIVGTNYSVDGQIDGNTLKGLYKP